MGDETSDSIRNLRMQRDKLNLEYRQEMKKLQMRAPDHLHALFHGHEKKLKALLESESTIFEELEIYEATRVDGQKELDEDIEKNKKKLGIFASVAMAQQKIDERMFDLVNEQEALKKRIIARMLEMGPLELEKLRGFYDSVKRLTDENDTQGMNRVGEMEKDLREREAEFGKLKIWSNIQGST